MAKKRTRAEERNRLNRLAKKQGISLSDLQKRLKTNRDRKGGQEAEEGVRTTEGGQDRVQEESGNLTPGEAEISPILSEDKHSTINFAGGSSPDYDYRTSLHKRSSHEERSSHEDITPGKGGSWMGNTRGSSGDRGGLLREGGHKGGGGSLGEEGRCSLREGGGSAREKCRCARKGARDCCAR